MGRLGPDRGRWGAAGTSSPPPAAGAETPQNIGDYTLPVEFCPLRLERVGHRVENWVLACTSPGGLLTKDLVWAERGGDIQEPGLRPSGCHN
ncbi:hypothetical protein NDU88_005011 [Pleurodeles waltl]|uniref:Uncharacterized protein n=1 Tax=Pleurodeles waltl TaxID=8319 RepID=A0AAV7MDB2_PLEWA|nr:hypothetical protein NDU88_005011 [Pleurodeles waltl]